MSASKTQVAQERLERVTRRWWFFVLLFAIWSVPPFAERNFSLERWGDIISQALSQAWLPYARPIQPLFHLAVVLLVVGVLRFGNKPVRLFNAYAAVSYVLFAVLQSIAVTEEYGVAVVSCNVIWFVLIGLAWAWEAVAGAGDFSSRKRPLWKYWVVPLALLAFWAPNKPWAFHPKYLLTSDSALAFCMMTPVYLGMLSLYWPSVNPVLLRVTGFVGIIIACCNIVFGLASGNIYSTVIHVPLLVISVYALILGLKQRGPASRDAPPASASG